MHTLSGLDLQSQTTYTDLELQPLSSKRGQIGVKRVPLPQRKRREPRRPLVTTQETAPGAPGRVARSRAGGGLANSRANMQDTNTRAPASSIFLIGICQHSILRYSLPSDTLYFLRESSRYLDTKEIARFLERTLKSLGNRDPEALHTASGILFWPIMPLEAAQVTSVRSIC